jgi:hypothetical protein
VNYLDPCPPSGRRSADASHRGPRGWALLTAVLAAASTLWGAGSAAAAPALERTWGTYFGGGGLDGAGPVGQDLEGNLYILGTTTSLDGIATPGAYQTVKGGSYDVFLAKFDPGGTPLWSTYFGGESQDLAGGLAVGADAVVIVGTARSTTGIATPGAFQPTNSGLDDGFAASFSHAGALQWGTYLGTSAIFESAEAVALDAQGAAYVVGYVGATMEGLGTLGTHQPEFNGGNRDGYLVKLTPQGKLVWGTYYGGDDFESLRSVSVNALGEIYAGGVASGSMNGIASDGAHQTSYGGGLEDNFLVRFNGDGTRMWGTYYGGEQQENGSFVAALPGGGVMFTGTTLSSDGIATPDAQQPVFAGVKDSYVSRFDSAGVRLWATYHGGTGGDYIQMLKVGANGTAYVCGASDSVSGIATPNGYLTTQQGNLDAFILTYTDAGKLGWGTYYGGAENDFCSGLFVDAQHRVLLVGGTESATGISTPGAHDETLQAVGPDGMIVQFTQSIGVACAGPGDCGDGPCVDGVCCDSPCGDGADDCQVCSVRDGATANGTCTLLAPAVVCRPSAGSCDVAEQCSGDAGICPADAPAEDGEPCDGGACSAGACVPNDASTGGESTGTTVSTSDTSTGDTSTGDTSTGDTSIGDTSTGDTTSFATTGELPMTDGDTQGAATTGDPGAPSSSSDTPTTAPTDDATDTTSTTDTTAEEPSQNDGAGCSCRSDADTALLGCPLLLLLARRRRRR